MKIIRFILAIMLLVFCAAACGTEPPKTLTIAPTNLVLPPGTTQQFVATGSFPGGKTENVTSQAAWSSSDPSVATINSSGLATTVAAGTTTITANFDGVSASTSLSVTSATLTSIAITPASPSIPFGVTKQFTATGTYSDATTFDLTSQVTWSSSVPSVATINSGGLVAAVAAGTSTITANLGSISGSTTLTVTSATLSSISITPSNPSIPVQSTQQFTAKGTYSDGTTFDLTSQVTWSSSDPSVATINSSGLATALAKGTTTITANLGNTAASMTLTVTSSALSSISITPANPSITIGATQQFAATAKFSDGTTSDITSQVVWTSSNASTATITASGLATAAAVGTTTITATSGSIQGTTILTVTAR